MQAETPAPPPVAVDPNLKAQQDAAQAELVRNLQVEAAGDTASVMARFGTRMALSGTASTSPLVAPPAAAPRAAPASPYYAPARGAF